VRISDLPRLVLGAHRRSHSVALFQELLEDMRWSQSSATWDQFTIEPNPDPFLVDRSTDMSGTSKVLTGNEARPAWNFVSAWNPCSWTRRLTCQ
jgi:hypothetical protein